MAGRRLCSRAGYCRPASSLYNPGINSTIPPQQQQRAAPSHPLHTARMVPDDDLLAICPALLLHFIHPGAHHTEKNRTKTVVARYRILSQSPGLILALGGGLLGSADLERLTMSVNEGEIAWRATNQSGEIKELSLAIQLDTFLIEEYPPRLVIIENETGRILPATRPDSYQFEEVGKTVQIAGVTMEILDYLPHAALSEDSTFLMWCLDDGGCHNCHQGRVNKAEDNQPWRMGKQRSYLFRQHVAGFRGTQALPCRLRR